MFCLKRSVNNLNIVPKYTTIKALSVVYCFWRTAALQDTRRVVQERRRRSVQGRRRGARRPDRDGLARSQRRQARPHRQRQRVRRSSLGHFKSRHSGAEIDSAE